MTSEELQKSLLSEATGGRIGVPLSLRASIQLADADTDLVLVATDLLQFAGELLSGHPSRLMAKSDAQTRQINALVEFDKGQTATITVGRGSVAHDEAQAILVGNHGIARLEGGELFEYGVRAENPNQLEWRRRLELCLKTGEPVEN